MWHFAAYGIAALLNGTAAADVERCVAAMYYPSEQHPTGNRSIAWPIRWVAVGALLRERPGVHTVSSYSFGAHCRQVQHGLVGGQAGNGAALPSSCNAPEQALPAANCSAQADDHLL